MSFDEVLERADIVALALPLSDERRRDGQLRN